MLLTLVATSILVMVQHEVDREARRAVSVATKRSPTDLNMVRRSDVWSGEEYETVWIEPAGSDRPVLPPGMSRLPEPGEAVVSPALDRLASHNPDLAERYPDRSVLGNEGVRSGDELFAYIRIEQDRTLVGNRSLTRAEGFGSTSNGQDSPGAGSFSSELIPGTVIKAGVLGFLVLPGLIVFVGGLATAAGFRGRLLWGRRFVEASRWKPTKLRVLEVSLLALPGLMLALIFWALVSPRFDRVPLVAHGVVRGDLRIPWWILAVELAAAVALTVVVAAVVTTITQVWRRPVTVQAGTRLRDVVSPMRQIPVGVALVALALGYVLIGPEPVLIAVIVLIVGAPLALPATFRAVGARLARIGPRPVSIAGSSIERSPFRAARPFVGATSLVVLAMTCVGYVSLARHIEQPPVVPLGETQAAFVDWADPQADDADRFDEALDQGLVVRFREDTRNHEEHALVVGGTCSSFARYLASISCKAGSPFGLSDAARQEIVNLLAPAAESADTEVRLVPPNQVGVSGDLAVVDDVPLEVLESRVRTEAMRTFPAPYVYSVLTHALYTTPAGDWIVNGSVIVIIVLAIGCLVSLIDRFLKAPERAFPERYERRDQLAPLGVRRFALSYGTSVVVGSIAGLMGCTLLVSGSGASMPWQGVGIVAVGVASHGLVATVIVAALTAGKGSEMQDHRSGNCGTLREADQSV